MSIGVIASAINGISPMGVNNAIRSYIDKLLVDSILVVDQINKIHLENINKYAQMIVLSNKVKFYDLAVLSYECRTRTHICKNLSEVFRFYSSFNSHQTDEIKMYVDHNDYTLDNLLDSCNTFHIIESITGLEHSNFSDSMISLLKELKQRVLVEDGGYSLVEYYR